LRVKVRPSPTPPARFRRDEHLGVLERIERGVQVADTQARIVERVFDLERG
jgi:hypothetical protein